MTIRERRGVIVASTIITVWIITALSGAALNPRASALVVCDWILLTASLALLLGIVLARWLVPDE